MKMNCGNQCDLLTFSFLLNEKSQNRTEEIQGSLNARVIIDQQYLIVEFF
jgi:hypothetical protein